MLKIELIFNKNLLSSGSFYHCLIISSLPAIFIICFTCLITDKLNSQHPIELPEETSADSMPAEMLKNSVLLVVLPSLRKKMEELESLSVSSELGLNEINKVKQQLKMVKSSRDFSNSLIIQSFIDYFNFSEKAFIYDYDIYEIKNGSDSVNLISETLQLEKIKIPNHFYLAVNQKTDAASSTNISSWRILDSSLVSIESPFPNSINISPIKKFFRGLFADESKELAKNYEDLAKKMNKKFNQYYERNRVQQN